MDIKNCNCNSINSDVVLTTLSLGNRLREARMSMGLSQQKIADSLCLKLSVITSIEENCINKLEINSIFVCGYIRSYARLVGIDNEERIIAFINELFFSPCVSREKKRTKFFYLLLEKCIKNNMWIFVVIGFIITIFFFILFSSKGFLFKKQRFNIFNLDSVMNISFCDWNKEYLSLFSEKYFWGKRNFCILPNDGMYSNYYLRDFLFYVDIDFLDVSHQLLNYVKNNIFFQDVLFFSNISMSDIRDVDYINNLLVMSFTSDCWIEVVDSVGEILYVGTQHSGDVLSFRGKIPYKLVVGAPQSIEIKYQGYVINLDKFIKLHKIAKLTIPC